MQRKTKTTKCRTNHRIQKVSSPHIQMKLKQDRQDDDDDGNGFMIFGSSKSDKLHSKVF